MTRATARAATLFAAQDLRVVERDLAPLGDGAVRVRFGAGGICGSDMHYFRHGKTGDFVVREPLVLGHEIAGTVESVGPGVSGLAPGQRVAVNPFRPCGRCARCTERRANLCENVFFMGSASKNPHMQGGFSSLIDTTAGQCVPVPDAVPVEAAALAEPLAVCLHAVARAGDVSGRRIAVVGAGPIGLLVLLAARHKGAGHVCVADIAAAPLTFARRLGANETVDLSAGEEALEALTPPDIVFEASGAPAGLAAAIGLVRRGGIVVQVGNLPAGPLPAPLNWIMSKELDLRGSFRFDAEFAQAVSLITSGAIDVTRLITGRAPLSRAPDAFRLALDRGQSVKVMLMADEAS